MEVSVMALEPSYHFVWKIGSDWKDICEDVSTVAYVGGAPVRVCATGGLELLQNTTHIEPWLGVVQLSHADNADNGYATFYQGPFICTFYKSTDAADADYPYDETLDWGFGDPLLINSDGIWVNCLDGTETLMPYRYGCVLYYEGTPGTEVTSLTVLIYSSPVFIAGSDALSADTFGDIIGAC
jgi:hypothetical protein